MSSRRNAAIAGASALPVAAGCALVTGGAEQDETEAERESAAEADADATATAPEVAVDPEGFGEGAVASTADVACEAAVLAAIAAAVTGAVHLARWRTSIFALLTSLLALLLGALAFLNSAT